MSHIKSHRTLRPHTTSNTVDLVGCPGTHPRVSPDRNTSSRDGSLSPQNHSMQGLGPMETQQTYWGAADSHL
eukprot:8913972-Pyramimonas_sp.AAC.2